MIKKNLKKFVQNKLEDKGNYALSTNQRFSQSAIESPYILGVWFHEVEKPTKE